MKKFGGMSNLLLEIMHKIFNYHWIAIEMPFCSSTLFSLVEKIGSVRVIIVKNEQGGNFVSIVLLRESIDSILDDLEKALEDGVNNYKAMCRDSCILPRPGVTEIELARKPKESTYKRDPGCCQR